MYEVEAKVKISKADFQRLSKELKKIAKYSGKIEKKDTYFNNPSNAVIRMRKEGVLSTLNIKEKNRSRGVEASKEIEWNILNNKNFTNILKKIDICPKLKKYKTTYLYKAFGFNMELNYIKNLGYFLEIERIVNTKVEVTKAKKDLHNIFKKFGYTSKNFESKYYLELLR